jgi:hypothetical protein
MCFSMLVISPPADWIPWARSIAEQVVDHKLNFVLKARR